MQATIVSTEQTLELDGVPVRLWRGTTQRGIAFLAFIHRVSVENGEQTAEFDAELTAQPGPEMINVKALSPRELLGLMHDAGIFPGGTR